MKKSIKNLFKNISINKDMVDDIMAWEDGSMSQEQEVKFFQGLIDSGQAWQLQGMYGRNAQALIDAGLCHKSMKKAMSAGEEEIYFDGLIESYICGNQSYFIDKYTKLSSSQQARLLSQAKEYGYDDNILRTVIAFGKSAKRMWNEDRNYGKSTKKSEAGEFLSQINKSMTKSFKETWKSMNVKKTAEDEYGEEMYDGENAYLIQEKKPIEKSYNLGQIKAANPMFFSTDTMRFFGKQSFKIVGNTLVITFGERPGLEIGSSFQPDPAVYSIDPVTLELHHILS